MLTLITGPDIKSYTFLADLLPLTEAGTAVLVEMKEDKPMILAQDWTWSGEWMKALRQRFDLTELQLWIAPTLADDAPALTAGTYELRLTESTATLYPSVAEKAPIPLTGAVDLYFEGWPEQLTVAPELGIDDWEVFLRFPTEHWYQWVGQDWELEIQRKDGKYYLTNTCAGFRWRAYPFLGQFARTIQNGRLDYTIQLEILEGLELAQEWPSFVGYCVATPKGQVTIGDHRVKDAAIQTGQDPHLYIFSEDPEVQLDTYIRVAAKAEILIAGIGDDEDY